MSSIVAAEVGPVLTLSDELFSDNPTLDKTHESIDMFEGNALQRKLKRDALLQ